MQETVRNSNERKSLFSSFLEILDAKEKQALADRQLQEEKYQRRTQRIYDFHDKQQREAAELQRCLEYVSQHAHVLETVLRGSGTAGGEDTVPLSAALVRQAAALQRCMADCVSNAARIRHMIAAPHRPQMDNMLAKMEAELRAWSAFVQRALDAAERTDTTIDNLCNILAEQRRCVREVSSSAVFRALRAEPGPAAPPAGPPAEQQSPARRAPSPRRSALVSSTPIAHD